MRSDCQKLFPIFVNSKSFMGAGPEPSISVAFSVLEMSHIGSDDYFRINLDAFLLLMLVRLFLRMCNWIWNREFRSYWNRIRSSLGLVFNLLSLLVSLSVDLWQLSFTVVIRPMGQACFYRYFQSLLWFCILLINSLKGLEKLLPAEIRLIEEKIISIYELIIADKRQLLHKSVAWLCCWSAPLTAFLPDIDNNCLHQRSPEIFSGVSNGISESGIKGWIVRQPEV